ncbi:MAG: ABC transporter permease [Myxococcales bacterium]|nr:ABC transporter permease [Myxococcales bacterium]
MSAFLRFGYFLKQSIHLTRTSPWLTAVSVLTLAVSLSLIGLLATVLFAANGLIDDLGARLTISVYVVDGTPKDRMTEIETRLRAHPGVKAVRALSREADRERNRKLLDPELLAGLDEEAIPGQPLLELELDSGLASRGDLDTLMKWAEKTRDVESVEDVEFGAEKLRLLFAAVEILRTVGFVLAAVMLASALFFVFSTIRLGVFSRRQEIEVLALMGATPRFIRAPFLLEGALQGLLGALVAMVFIGLLHAELQGLVRDMYRINMESSLLPPTMVLWLLVGGPVLGLMASGVSVGRYLRV